MKIIVATLSFSVLIFVAVLNEIMIEEIKHHRNYSFTASSWQRFNIPHRECPKADMWYECKKLYLKNKEKHNAN